jgi:hypothetical protein
MTLSCFDDDPINDYSSAVFTALELERVREIVAADSIATIQSVATELTAEQRRATRYDINLWYRKVGEGTISIHGGTDGIDYSRERDRNAIRQRVALRFGLDVPNTVGLFRLPVAGEFAECVTEWEW